MQVLRLHLATCCSSFDLDCVYAVLGRAGEFAVALDDGDLVLLHQELQSLGVLVDDPLLALLDRSPVQSDAGSVLHAKLGAFLHVVVDFRVEQQGLGRNTADVQAGSAQLVVFLDKGGLQAELAGANGGGVSSRAAADDGYVINGVRQFRAPILQDEGSKKGPCRGGLRMSGISATNQ